MKGLQDKVIIIAGGATGLGAATAKRLGSEGSRVLVADLNASDAQKTVNEITETGGIAELFVFDISKEASCKDLVETAMSRWGALNGLYNTAADLSPGNLGRDTDVVTCPVDVLKHTLEVNLMGFFYTSRYAIPAMLESGGGSIVHMTSGVVLGLPFYVSYGAAKGGVIALSRHIAARYGKEGIRSNTIDPGITLTENQRMMVTDEMREAILPSVRAPHYGTPEEIAATVAFLLSDETHWINGQTLSISSMEGAR